MKPIVLSFYICLYCSVVFGLEVQLTQLQSGPVDVAANESLLVRVSFTNDGDGSLYILKWNTVLDDQNVPFRSDSFEIVHDTSDTQGVYKGSVIKRRSMNSAEDFILLQANQTLSFDIDLVQGYWLPEMGTYAVTLRDPVFLFQNSSDQLHEDMDQLKKVACKTNFVFIKISTISDFPKFPGEDLEPGLLGTVTPNANCPTNNASTIRTADSNAATLLSRVNSYLSNSCNGGNYVTWMGACDASRYSTVKSHFSAISSRQGSGYRVDCAGSSCSANTYAYVYPTDSTFTVYVCGAFWTASVNTCVFDSKSGTIIHELSHFNAVAGTSDIAYGTSACQNLARTNPAQAIRNADNHEYLAESCP